MVEVSMIIVNFNGREQTIKCIDSILSTQEKGSFEIIVVDNGSHDGSVEAIKNKYSMINVKSQKHNLGFGSANNAGAIEAVGEYYFFVNNDTIFKEDLIRPLKRFMEENSSCGVAGPMLLNVDGTYQHSCGKYPSFINELRTKRDTAIIKNIPKDRSPKEVDWISFAAVLVRKSAFKKVNGFDERYFMYFEDADICFRMKKEGYRSIYCAEHSLIHYGGGSRHQEVSTVIKTEYRRSQLIFYSSHRSWFESLALRVFLFLRFLYPFLCARGEEHRRARSVIIMALSYHAHRS